MNTLTKHTLLIAEARALVSALGEQKLSPVGKHTVDVLTQMADAMEAWDVVELDRRHGVINTAVKA